jgi:hypothetical protein
MVIVDGLKLVGQVAICIGSVQDSMPDVWHGLKLITGGIRVIRSVEKAHQGADKIRCLTPYGAS